MISVTNQVREYPDEDGPYQTLVVRNHWSRTDRVVLEIEGRSYTFLVNDLRRAITNAANH